MRIGARRTILALPGAVRDVIFIATVALAVLLAGRPVRAQEPDLTLICDFASKKIVHLEIIQYGGSTLVRDGILQTTAQYPPLSRQMIESLVQDYRRREGYRCSVTHGAAGRKD
jgi:hypothetical protein